MWLTDNIELILPIAALLGGLVGKVLSDQGKAALVKELNEANCAMVTAAKNFAPGWDLAFNIGIGKLPLDEVNMFKLKNYAKMSWTDAKKLSTEIKDVFEQLEPAKKV